MGRITSFSKQVIKFLICFSLIYTPTLLFASAAEKWTIQEVVYDNVAKNLTYTASRPNALAINDLVYKAKVPVTPAATGSTVASMIRLGLAGAAIYGIIEGVGWVIDNGVVKKYEKPPAEDENIQYQYLWYNENFTYDTCRIGQSYSTSSAAVQHIITCTKAYGSYVSTDFADLNNVLVKFTRAGNNCCQTVVISKKSNPKYDKDYEPPKLVPVSPSELGEQVIDSPQAPNLIPDIYSPNNPVPRPSPAPDAVQKTLDNAPPTPKQEPTGDTKPKPNTDTDGDGKPDTYDPQKPSVGEEFTLPEFCSWAVTVCEWYTKYKEDSDLVKEHREAEKSFWQKVEDWFDWSKDDLPEYPDSQLDIPDQSPPDINTDISFGGSCPASRSVPVSFAGISTEIEFSFQWFCEIASIAKPVIISISAFASALIVAGVRTEDD